MQPDNRGGYQAPSKPAPASGPGKFSRRTDGQPLRVLPDAQYGEQATYQAQQHAAPAAQSDTSQPAELPPAVDMSRITPLSAPSQYPDEAVTAGADMGAGPTSAALGLPTQQPISPQVLASLSDMLPTLEIMAQSPNATDSFRNFVRDVFANS